MYQTRTRKILRDVMSRKGRTALVSIAIFIGVAGTIVLFSMGDILVSRLREDIKEDRLVMVQVLLAPSAQASRQVESGEPLDNEAYLQEMHTYPNVTDVRGAAQNQIRFRADSDGRFEEATTNSFVQLEPQPERDQNTIALDMQEYTLSDDLEGLRLEPMQRYDGTLQMTPHTEINPLEAGYSGEVVIEQRFSEEFDVETGDTLEIRVLSRDAMLITINDTTHTFSTGYTLEMTDGTYTATEDAEPVAFESATLTFSDDGGLNMAVSGQNNVDGLTLPDNLTPDQNAVITFNSGTLTDIYGETTEYGEGTELSVDARTVRVEKWRIVGIAFQPYNQVPDQSVFLGLEDNNYLSGTVGLTEIAARFDRYERIESTASQQDFAAAIADASNGNYIPGFPFSEDPEQNSLITGVQTISSVLGMLAVIALVVSGFLVINVINAIVVEQKRQIGVMKSMGANRADNFYMYSGIAFTYGLIGVIPGLLVGIAGGNAASHALAPEVNTVLEGFKISIPSIIVGVIIGLAVPVIFSLIPVWNGTRVKILDAMTDLGIDVNYGSGPIAKGIKMLPVPITIRQGFSNVSIKKGRLALTVATLTIAVGAFMGIYAIFFSLSSGIQSYLDVFNVEIFITPVNPDDTLEMQAALQEISEEEDLRLIEPAGQLVITFKEVEIEPSAGGPPGIFIYAYDSRSDNPAFRVDLDGGEGELINEDNYRNAIIVSTVLAGKLDAEVGDQYTVQGAGSEQPFTIVGIADFGVDQVWMDWRALSEFANLRAGAPQPDSYISNVEIEGLTDAEDSENLMSIEALGMSPQTASRIVSTMGGGDTPGVIMNDVLADLGGYEQGNEITVLGEDGESATLPVQSIITLPPQMLPEGFSPETPLLTMPFDTLVEIENPPEGGDIVPLGYALTTDIYSEDYEDTKDAREIEARMDSINDALLERGIPSTPFNFVEIINQITSGIFIFQVIFSVVAGLIALVGALGLLITLSMSVFERQKEIGVMRSIGAGSTTVALQFLTEGLITGILAWLLGLPLSYLIAQALISALNFGDTFTIDYPIEAAIIGLVGMLIITTIASIGPALSAANRTVSDILRYQ